MVFLEKQHDKINTERPKRKRTRVAFTAILALSLCGINMKKRLQGVLLYKENHRHTHGAGGYDYFSGAVACMPLRIM